MVTEGVKYLATGWICDYIICGIKNAQPNSLDYFKECKQRVPTYGVIVFNRSMDKVVMVRSYGARSWNFPKGKVNEKEAGHDCAAREVAEEIGINLHSKLDLDSWIEKVRIE